MHVRSNGQRFMSWHMVLNGKQFELKNFSIISLHLSGGTLIQKINRSCKLLFKVINKKIAIDKHVHNTDF